MPALFALGSQVLGNGTLATFAAFGSFAMLLADFGGTLAERLVAQAWLVAVGCLFIPLATVASQNAWTAAAAMVVVGFLVLFSGVVSSTLAAASTSALLGFILPVATPAGPEEIPDRLLGWLLAGVGALPSVALLWPAPRREPLRNAAAQACRQLSARLTAEGRDSEDVAAAVVRADAALAALRRIFLATPYRPSGLTTANRAVVRLVDQVVWLGVVLDNAASTGHWRADATVREVKVAAAVLLDHAGKSLSLDEPPQDSLQDHLDDLARARRAMEAAAIADVRVPVVGEGTADVLVRSLHPGFRAQELSFAAAAIAQNVEIATEAEQRTWWQKLLGRQRPGAGGALAAAQARALAHVEPHSVWLRNSLRGAIALGGAVLVADLSGVQHSFWIVLGALSVLRSNALSTGQNVVRGLVGTAVGFLVGGALVLVLRTNHGVLWALLPVAILVAGMAPAISFAAGQAGFTVALLVLFNIISPAGWQVGLVRIEDVAIGCAVSLVVGALFWPRGAAGALRRGLAEAYADSAAYLRATAEGDPATGRSELEPARQRAAASARRLDDAFREYLAERGPKRLSLAEVATLLTGVAGLRLITEAVADLWESAGPSRPDTPRAQLELVVSAERVTNWYAAMAQAMAGAGTVPHASPAHDGSASRLVEALGLDLAATAGTDEPVRAHTVRMIWASDHVDVSRRLQELVERPARAAASRGTTAGSPFLPWQRTAGDDDVAAVPEQGARAQVRG